MSADILPRISTDEAQAPSRRRKPTSSPRLSDPKFVRKDPLCKGHLAPRSFATDPFPVIDGGPDTAGALTTHALESRFRTPVVWPCSQSYIGLKRLSFDRESYTGKLRM